MKGMNETGISSLIYIGNSVKNNYNNDYYYYCHYITVQLLGTKTKSERNRKFE